MDLTISEMQEMQRTLQAKYFDKWGGLPPAQARQKLLWLFSEAGEAADVIKKQGDEKILQDATARALFIEEMADVLMYFNDVLLCYDITPEEFSTNYRKKHIDNMNRW